MKKLFVSFLSIGFISATCVFVSCNKKKKEDPAPVATTTSGTTTSGTTTTGTTTTGTSTSGTTSGTTTSGTTTSGTLDSGSFNDGTTSISNATSKNRYNDQDHLIIEIKGSTEFPSVMLDISKPIIAGTFTNTSNGNDFAAGIVYSLNPPEYYSTDEAGATYSVTITSITSSEIKGTFTFKGLNEAGASKTVTGSFYTSLAVTSTTSGSTSSGTTTSGSTTAPSITSAGFGTGSFNDGTNHPTASGFAYVTTSNPNILNISLTDGTSSYPEAAISLKKPITIGSFTSTPGSYDYMGNITYSLSDFYSTLIGGTNNITVTTSTASRVAGTFSFTAKNNSGGTKSVTGSFDITLQ